MTCTGRLRGRVKGIYAGLVMVEAKCIEIDDNQAAQANLKAMDVEGLPCLTNKQWKMS